MASSLNDLRSSMAFSYNDNLRVHLWHTYGETTSSSSIVMSNIAEILEDHMPALLKRLIVFSTFVHSLHTFTEAIASKFSKHASIIYVTGYGKTGLIAGLVKIDFFSRKGIY